MWTLALQMRRHAANIRCSFTAATIEDVRNAYALDSIEHRAAQDAVRAAVRWNARRDVPDIVGWEDLRRAPEAVVALIQQRLAEGRIAGQTWRMPLAKPDPSRSKNPLRWACVSDPATELALRLHISRAIAPIESRACRIGDDVVCGGRVKSGGTLAGWSQAYPNYLRDRQVGVVADVLQGPSWWALGKADIQSFYPSLSKEVICVGLADSGVADELIEPIRTLLTELSDLWGIKGLPIGPEWSPVLANTALFRLDEDLQAAGIRHTRWIDDVAFVFDGPGWDDARTLFEASLSRLGLEPNTWKYGYTTDRAEALAEFVDPVIAEMKKASPQDAKVQHAVSVYHELAQSDLPHPTRLRFTVGFLATQGVADVVASVVDRPDLLAIAPRQFGNYFARLLQNRVADLDLDWLVERSTAAPTEREAVGQLHLLRACCQAPSRWTRQHAEAFARCAANEKVPQPVRCWAVMAHASTQHFKPSVAVERAEGTGDTHLQRAWTIALSKTAGGRKVRHAAKRLQALPDCAPAAQMVLQAA